MEKIVRDGMVAVAVSYGYGAGWSTWNDIDPMDARFNQLFLDGKADEVVYWNAEGEEHAQRAKAVVLCANGAETPRLLLLSASAQHPQGLGNSSGFVGQNLMFTEVKNPKILLEFGLHVLLMAVGISKPQL